MVSSVFADQFVVTQSAADPKLITFKPQKPVEIEDEDAPGEGYRSTFTQRFAEAQRRVGG